LFGPVVDRLLGRLVSRSFRRGLAGEPVWLAVGAAAWLVVRSRRRDKPIVWSGTLNEGQALVLTNRGRLVSGQESGKEQPG
jgi:hypothetical protein